LIVASLAAGCSDDGTCPKCPDCGSGSPDKGPSPDGGVTPDKGPLPESGIAPDATTVPDVLAPPDTKPSPDTVPPKSNVGGPCATPADCKPYMGYTALCMTYSKGGTGNWNWPGGYCTFGCNYKNPNCPPGSVCSNYGTYFFTTGDRCVLPCASDTDCRPQYECDSGECFPTTPAP
jgi:hypothetical protein